MKKWFEKWAAEKAKRREKGLPAIVEYRDETYVSGLCLVDFNSSQPITCHGLHLPAIASFRSGILLVS